MRTRLTGVLSVISLVLTAVWVILLITSMATAGPRDSFEQVLAHVAQLDALYYLNYHNAALLTVAVTMLFAALYALLRPDEPTWAAVGVMFIPVYAAFNLVAYLTQVTVVPRLILRRAASSTMDTGLLVELLRQLVQGWEGSAIWVLNNLGYAVLGIPSIIFGVLLARRAGASRWAGVLLALSGAASIAGMVGIVANSAALSIGSVVGGGLFLVALIPLSIAFLRREA